MTEMYNYRRNYMDNTNNKVFTLHNQNFMKENFNHCSEKDFS